MDKVAIYCRESTERQDISTLISMCEKAAHDLGFDTYKIYKDIKSGYSKDREEYSQLKNDIQAGEINVLILYESSRLTRDEIEHHLFFALLRIKEVRLYTLNHGWIDLNNEDDTFMSSLLNLLDAREGRKGAKRTKDRMEEIARNGRWTGGPAPFGYRLVNKELVVDPAEAEIVKQIFQLFLEGKKRQTLSTLFGFEGKRVRRMLINPVYVGKLKFHQIEYKNKKRITHKEWEVLDGIHEAIIDEPTFNLVQNRLKLEKREVKRDTYIFKDLLKCVCGAKLYRYTSVYTYNGQHKESLVYKCNSKDTYHRFNSILESELLEQVLETLEEVILSLDVNDIDAESDNSLIEQLNYYKKEAATLPGKEKILARQLMNNLLTEETFKELMLEFKEQKEFFKNKIDSYSKLIKSKEAKKNNQEILKKYFNKIKKEKDPEKLNIFFKMIIDSIEFVNDYRFYIHLKF